MIPFLVEKTSSIFMNFQKHFVELLCLENVQGGLLCFFARAFTVRGRRYEGQTGEKLPFPPFLREVEEERVKTGDGDGGRAKNKNREEWRSVCKPAKK